MGALIEPLWHLPESILLVAFIAFFLGYAVGRRQGKREGFAEGVRYAPLEMRRQTWEKGHCVICGSGSTKSVGGRTKGEEESGPQT